MLRISLFPKFDFHTIENFIQSERVLVVLMGLNLFSKHIRCPLRYLSSFDCFEWQSKVVFMILIFEASNLIFLQFAFDTIDNIIQSGRVPVFRRGPNLFSEHIRYPLRYLCSLEWQSIIVFMILIFETLNLTFCLVCV